MGDDDLSARKQNAKQNLLNIDTLQSAHLASEVLQADLNVQLQTIQDETFFVEQQLNDLSVISETYDREFRDRMANPGPKPYLKTTHDWILAIFFMSYSLFMVAAASFTFMRYPLTISLVSLVIFISFAMTYTMYKAILQFA
jgi:hypothetical protein